MEVSRPDTSATDLARLHFEQLREQRAEDLREKARAARDELVRLSEKRAEWVRTERSSASTEHLEQVRDSSKKDQVQLSPAVKAVSEGSEAGQAERSARVAALKSLHEAGELVSPDRIERAAERILEQD